MYLAPCPCPEPLREVHDQMAKRSGSDFVLLALTVGQVAWAATVLGLSFTLGDVLYLGQHLAIAVLALVRRVPHQTVSTPGAVVLCGFSYAYPYAVTSVAGDPAQSEPISSWAMAGLTLSAAFAIWVTVTLGSSFGVRPARRTLVRRGPYRMVRHPLYATYIWGDACYLLLQYSLASAVLTIAGWLALAWRARLEEAVLACAPEWPQYAASVRYRLVPGIY